MTERKYPVRDSGPMYSFPMPTEVVKAELAEAKAMIDAALELHKPEDMAFLAKQGWAYCLTCVDDSWPCDTAKALGVTYET